MKQRLAVRAIIKKDNKTLLLRRSSGRPSILKKYELPGGSIEYDEQPQDAIRRHILQDTGLAVQSMGLVDVSTHIDQDDRDVQYGIILFAVEIGSSGSKVQLRERYDHYQWRTMQNIYHNDVTSTTLELLSSFESKSTGVDVVILDDDINTSVKVNPTHLIIYSDGGSRGNPGPSAAGFVVLNSNEEVITEGGEYLGITTNNQAEYHGVRLGLEQAVSMSANTVDFRIDSLLVVNQMKGLYKIKNRELWPIHERIRELVGEFDKVTFTHVRREFNQLADGMVNKILNEQASS